MYNQLTLAQRYIISSSRQNGFSMQTIADEIYRIESEEAKLKGEHLPKKHSVSTISRELRRNRTKTGRYNPRTANEMAMERRERIVRKTTLKPRSACQSHETIGEAMVPRTDLRQSQIGRHSYL